MTGWSIRNKEETMKLGIIGAMQVEVEQLVAQLEQVSAAERCGTTYYEGKLEGTDVVVVRCGVGKVNAALCVQILCDCYAVTHLVNTGIAGSLSARLDIGDLVISDKAMYHDFDCNVFGYPIGMVPGMEENFFRADPRLTEHAFAAAEEINPGHTCIGTVASGDQFVNQKQVKARIISDTGAMCTEMEGAAIAHAAWRNGVPFVIIRAISDKADDSADMDYPTFETIAAHRCAAVTKAFARKVRGE